MNNWAVYRHTSPSGKCYIGISSNVKDRWANNGYNYGRYNSIFKKAIEKYGWNALRHEILLEGRSKSEADYAEKYLIRWYKIHGLSYNITDGGDGKAGVVPSDASRKKASENNIGKHPYNPKAIEASRAAVAKMSEEERKEKFGHYGMQGKEHSEETKKKMSQAAKGRDMSKALAAYIAKKRQNAVPIVVTKDGKFIGEYQLLIDACKDLSLDPANAARSLTKGYRVKGYCLTYKM